MVNNAPCISVIVSIFNTEKYLPRCIESILAQTYQKLELLLVNDGSSDKSGEICNQYQKLDSRIKVVHKKNTGQSDSQNLAISMANGELVTFVDSDDFVHPEFLEILQKKMEFHDADVSICSYTKKMNLDIIPDSEKDTDIVLTGIEAMKDVFISGGKVNPETWAKLYKKTLFVQNDVRFPAGYTAGDQHTTYRLMYFSKKVALTRQILFHYTQRVDSITGVSFKPERLSVLNAGIAAIDFVKERNQLLESYARCFFVGLNLYLINQILKDKHGDSWIETLIELRKLVLENSSPEVEDLLASKRRWGIRLLRLGYWAYTPARKIFMLYEERKAGYEYKRKR